MADREYIERGALLKEIFPYDDSVDPKCYTMSAKMIQKAIQDAPAADVAPVVHGYWKWETKIEPQAQNRLYCSVCDNECLAKGDYYEKSKYCPHCGARMDGERKEQT